MTHKRQISGDTVGSGNDFAGHGNKLGDLGFSIRDTADTVDALHLTNTLQTLGKRLRVDEAGSSNDGIQIRGKQATSEQDLFQVFRNPSNKTVLSLKNPSGATPFVHLDLDTEKAVFKELDLECRDLTVTGQVTALEVVDINASGDVTIGGTATITGAINDYFLGAACAKTLGTVVAESAGLVTGDQVHDAVELRQLLSKKVDDKAAYDYGAGVGQSYALNTLRYPSTKCMAELLADSHVDLDADIAANTAAIAAQEDAIADNTSKVGISTDQAAAIVLNTAKNSISQSQTDAIIANTAAIALNTDKVGISTDQAAAIVLNTAKNSITQTQTDAIIANTSNIATNTALNDTQAQAIIDNTADIATNATAIALNTDKNSITQTQTDAIIANTADIAALGNASTKNITAGFIIADDMVTTALYVADNFQEILTNVSNTELGYLDGVTSAIQTQLAGKQAIHNDVSNAELGYLNGVTSAIQTQFTGKEPLLTTAANLNVRTVTANQFFHTVTDGHPGGYGFYRFEGTTNTTDMNQSDGTAECVPWTVKYEDSTTFSFDGTNSKRIQVAATGFYEVSFTILMTTTQPRPGNTVRLHVGNDAGTTATPYVAMGYIRAAENHNEASWNLPTTLLYLTEDDWICVYGKYEGRGNTGGVFLLYDTANISTLLIKRVS